MDPTDILLTIVEISVALAGFASLVTVIGRRENDEGWKRSTAKLRLMLESTLRVAAIALVAIPFIQQVPGPLTWRLLSGLHIASAALHLAYSLRRHGQSPSSYSRGLTRSIWAIGVVGVAASAANVVGYAPIGSFGMFLVSLVSGLLVAGISFGSVASSVLRDEPGGSAA